MNLFRRNIPPVEPPLEAQGSQQAHFEYQEAPILDSEEGARQVLNTTGPVVTGTGGRIGTRIPTPQAQPNLRQPSLNVEIPQQKPVQPTLGAEVGQERMSRMVQPQQETTQTGPTQESLAFAAGKQGAPMTSEAETPVVATPEPTPTKTMPIINANDPHSGMNALNSLVDEEEQLRRGSVTNQRILALGDALRQIGNIYHTVNGAPSQQFNNPVQEERQRYQQEKAIRDNDRYKQMAAKQSAAMSELKRKQFENEEAYRKESIAIRKSEHDRLVKQAQETERKNKELEAIKRRQIDLEYEKNTKKISIEEYRAESDRLKARAAMIRANKYQPGGASGVGNYETITETTHEPEVTDPITGEVKKWKSKTTRKRTGRNGSGNSSDHKSDPFGNSSSSSTDHKSNPFG